MQRDVVSREDLERELRAIEALAPGQIEGVFGPASLTWRIDREAAIFLAAGRALLLQLAHPYVAAAIAEHSRTLADPGPADADRSKEKGSEVRQSGLQLYSPFVELPQPEPLLVRAYLEASYASINVQHNDWRGQCLARLAE